MTTMRMATMRKPQASRIGKPQAATSICMPQALLLLLFATAATALVPKEGLVRGRVHVVSSDDANTATTPPDAVRVVLGTSDVSAGGWGDGAHPSTALCLEWLSGIDWAPGASFLDYGCGSGVLMLAARRLGCADALGVDVEYEALESSEANAAATGVGDGVRFVHGRTVVPGDEAFDYVCANILVGQLSRPSMVATLALGCKPGGALCLSGVRPEQADVLRPLYAPYFDFDAASYAERAPDAHGAEYWGTWARMVLRRRDADDRRTLLDAVSEGAIN